MHRLRGVFLTAMGAEETQIEASFCEAIRIAMEQKSISLEKRARETYAEYRSQKVRALWNVQSWMTLFLTSLRRPWDVADSPVAVGPKSR